MSEYTLHPKPYLIHPSGIYLPCQTKPSPQPPIQIPDYVAYARQIEVRRRLPPPKVESNPDTDRAPFLGQCKTLEYMAYEKQVLARQFSHPPVESNPDRATSSTEAPFTFFSELYKYKPGNTSHGPFSQPDLIETYSPSSPTQLIPIEQSPPSEQLFRPNFDLLSTEIPVEVQQQLSLPQKPYNPRTDECTGQDLIIFSDELRETQSEYQPRSQLIQPDSAKMYINPFPSPVNTTEQTETFGQSFDKNSSLSSMKIRDSPTSYLAQPDTIEIHPPFSPSQTIQTRQYFQKTSQVLRKEFKDDVFARDQEKHPPPLEHSQPFEAPTPPPLPNQALLVLPQDDPPPVSSISWSGTIPHLNHALLVEPQDHPPPSQPSARPSWLSPARSPTSPKFDTLEHRNPKPQPCSPG